jgi:hypothetical protein
MALGVDVRIILKLIVKKWDMEWIRLDRDRNQWQALLKIITKAFDPLKARIILAS